MPLLHQPGEDWEYSVSTDVLGRVVEVVSGMDLDGFVQERITGPLKMNDTGFWVKPAAISRLAKAGWRSPTRRLTTPPRSPPYFRAAAACSPPPATTRASRQMLLNGGELEGVRILAPKTIALMTSDQLPADDGTPHAGRDGVGTVRSGP